MEKLVKTQEVSHYRNVIVGSKTLARLLDLELENFDFLVEQLTWKDRYSEEDASEAVEEYRKWMALIIISKDEIFTETYFGKPVMSLGMPSMHIDSVWHRHITFTKDYSCFCERINGAMIHHNPCTRANVASMNGNGTKQIYQIVFGEFPAIWLEKDDFMKSIDLSIADNGLSGVRTLPPSASAQCEYILSAECEYILAAECQYIV